MVQNEINNLGFLTGEGQTKMSKVNMSDIAYDEGGYNKLINCPVAVNHHTNLKCVFIWTSNRLY